MGSTLWPYRGRASRDIPMERLGIPLPVGPPAHPPPAVRPSYRCKEAVQPERQDDPRHGHCARFSSASNLGSRSVDGLRAVSSGIAAHRRDQMPWWDAQIPAHALSLAESRRSSLLESYAGRRRSTTAPVAAIDTRPTGANPSVSMGSQASRLAAGTPSWTTSCPESISH